MSFLKKVGGGEVSILKMLHASLGGMEPARSLEVLHASELTREDPEFCPRERIIMLQAGLKPHQQMVNTPLRVTFDVGHATQAMFNNQWLRDRMFGAWKCTKCGGGWAGVGSNTCAWSTDCDGTNPVYEELQFKHSDIPMLSGSVDALITTSGKHLMVEVKIMAVEAFKKLQAPLSEHKARTQFYLGLIENSTNPFKDQINTKEARVLYICRGFGFKNDDGLMTPFKEFTVTRNDDTYDHYLAKAYQVFSGVKSGVPTPKICDNVTCKRADQCRVKVECFSGEVWGG